MNLEIFDEILKELRTQTSLLREMTGGKVEPLAVSPYVKEMKTLDDLVNAKDWPEAVDPEVICREDDENMQSIRAESVVEMMIDDFLKDLKFLDIGCGNGHVVNESLKQEPTLAVGYDIKTSSYWEKFKSPNSLFTTSIDEVREKGPYDVILIYDVLDHVLEPNNPADILKIARDLLHPNGKIYVRCHPFCSRTGTHLYYEKNKAFLHLVFSELELIRMGLNSMPTRKIIHPMLSYQQWIKEANLNEVYSNVFRENVEGFFEENEEIAKKIKMNWKNSHEPALRDGVGFPKPQMEMQWIDFVLSKK